MKYELIYYCENDKFAKKAYSLIHNELESKNLGDITLVNEKEIADFNWMVGGSPCQDFSVAGKGKGAVWTCKDCKDDEGNDYQYNPLEVHYTKRDKCPKCNSTNIEKTRSSLVVGWLRILFEKKPNVAIYENVKNLVGKKHKYFFDLFINELHEYGYNTYWKVLNAKNYGIPQNRERVYLIIIKKELDNGKFQFPEGFDNGIRLKDLLEKEVDEKYYISQEKTDKLIEQLKSKEYSNTVRSSGRGSLDRHSWDMVCVKDVYYRIRKLTPLECFRLMGFSDEDFYILKENGISDTQCYKMAGNSIVVDVLYYIYLELYKAMPYLFENIKLGSFFSGIGAFEKAIIRLQKTIHNKNINIIFK